MITQRHYPRLLKHNELDAYLAKGWYRMGQMIFTCHFLCFESGIFSPIWVRLDLKNYKFKKRLRKLMRKNEQEFRYIIQKANLSEEKEALYQKYKNNFDGILAETLRDSLMDSSNINIYDTREICIYQNKKLIAFSFFDVGAQSLASIMGIYDPDYEDYSLGFYSMLLEINWGLENEKEYFYPGYVVPGNQRFEYKLRVGAVDYFDAKASQWFDWSTFNIDHLPINILKTKILAASEQLNQVGIKHKIGFYIHFEEILHEFRNRDFLKYPLYISVNHHAKSSKPLIIEYDLIEGTYRLSKYTAITILPSVFYSTVYENYDINEFTYMGFLIREMEFLCSNDVVEISNLIIKDKLKGR